MAVNIVTAYGLDAQGSIPNRDSYFCLRHRIKTD